jgi:hypothetical protein
MSEPESIWYQLKITVYPHKCFIYYMEVADNVILSFYDINIPTKNLLVKNQGTPFFEQNTLTFAAWNAEFEVFNGAVILNSHVNFSKSPYLGFILTPVGNRMIGIEYDKLVEYFTDFIYIDMLAYPPINRNGSRVTYDENGNATIKTVARSLQQYPYTIQKQIQNTVRVPASLYVDNIGALNIFQGPRVWNQMSDRTVPAVQKTSTSGTCSTRGTITRCRPNACCPGGAGVDVKHGSYARYLGRLKGAKPFRAEPIPKDYGIKQFIKFNPAFPIYGNKTLKTSIVETKCLCKI